MKKGSAHKYWWLLLLIIFNFLYYYLIQYLTSQKSELSQIEIKWEGVGFLFLISLISIWCARFIRLRVNKSEKKNILIKYLKILLYSFLLFIIITACSQVLLEYTLGQNRNLGYILGNLIIYVFLHIIVGNTYIGIEYFKESSSLRQDLHVIEKSKYQTELKILQQQMSPHFLFNNLNSLASLIAQDENKAINYTHALSSIFRHVSQNAKKDIITLNEELDFLSNYMELINFRFGLAYIVNMQLNEINTEKILAIPLALQVIIENVIKHNSGSRKNPLKIDVFTDEDYLIIKNEIRLKTISKNQKSGVGLENLNARYQLVTGSPIIYTSSSDYFTIKLPLIKKIEDDSSNN